VRRQDGKASRTNAGPSPAAIDPIFQPMIGNAWPLQGYDLLMILAQILSQTSV
jgi:hypothetical protein